MARRRSLDRVLDAVRSEQGEARAAAIYRLGGYDFASSRPTRRQRAQALELLLFALRHDANESVRVEAADVLEYWKGTRGTDARILGALLDALDDERQAPQVRGQAAEGTSSYLSYGAGTRALRLRASTIFLRHLRHPSALIRFWCIYAVGMARMNEARALLEEIAQNDDARVPHLWRVADEAADVLLFLDGGEWPDRIPGD